MVVKGAPERRGGGKAAPLAPLYLPDGCRRSTRHCAARGLLKYHRLAELDATFHEASDILHACHYHFLHSGDTRLDGHRVLLVVQPGVTRVGSTTNEWGKVPRLHQGGGCG